MEDQAKIVAKLNRDGGKGWQELYVDGQYVCSVWGVPEVIPLEGTLKDYMVIINENGGTSAFFHVDEIQEKEGK